MPPKPPFRARPVGPKKKSKKAPQPPPFKCSTYARECFESIFGFLKFVFASDYGERKNELLEASVDFVSYT